MSAKTVLPGNKLSKKNLSKAQYVSGNKYVAPVSVERFRFIEGISLKRLNKICCMLSIERNDCDKAKQFDID